MSRPIPPHGHPNRYAYGCRCTPCTRAATRADAERRLDRLDGRPRTIPAGPVQEHVRALLERLTVQQIARESGVEPSTVRRLLSGVQRTVRRGTAGKLLAVPVTVRPVLGDVPSVGAVRRLRALYALGHFNRDIAAAAGVSRDAVCALVAGNWATVKVQLDEGVRRAYDRLSMTAGGSWKTRRLAEREGWAPPLAWDDDIIDDPRAVPQRDAPAAVPDSSPDAVDRWLHGESVVLDDTGRRRAVAHLMEFTSLSAEEIGARLEMRESAVKRSWERVKARARAEGGPVPYRRMVPAAVAQLAKAA